jgi:hypothetical protein
VDCSFTFSLKLLRNFYHLLLHIGQYVESLPYQFLLIFQAGQHYIYQDLAILFIQKPSPKILLVNLFIKSIFIFKFLQPLAFLINLVFIYSQNYIIFYKFVIALP